MSAGVTPASAKAAGPDHTPRRIGEVDLAAVLVLHAPRRRRARLTSGRFRLFAISGRVTTTAPPPSVMTQQSRRCSGSATIGELSTSSHGDDVAQHGVRIVLGVMGGGDLDPGELLAGGAELVHVAHGAHAVDD